MLVSGILKTLISGNSEYIFTFWMLNRIVKGFLITLVASAIIKNKKLGEACFFSIIFIAIIYANYDIVYIMCPILSFMAFWFYKRKSERKKCLDFFGKVTLIIGILFSFVPGKYSFMYILGTILVIVGAVLENDKIKIPIRKLSYLSKISTEVYFIHQPITTTVCAAMFLVLNKIDILSMNKKVIILTVLYFLILFIACYFIKSVEERLHNWKNTLEK